MKKKRGWAARWVVSCALATLLGLVAVGDVQGAYVDCRMCHLDPALDSQAKDYFEYFVDPQRQHPTGMAYPAAIVQEFFPPTAWDGEISFFDTNGNGIPDLDEIQVFGINGTVECASCHREHGTAPPPEPPNMYLRLRTELLCSVCHRR